MNNRQLAHLWANGATKGRGSNMFIDGTTVYSYGAHFPIARHVENKEGRKAVLFTTRGYSNSTAKHIGHVRSALHGLGVPVFTLHDISEKHSARTSAADYSQRIETAMQEAARATKYAFMHEERAQALAKEANDFAEFYGFAWRMKRPELTEEFRASVKEANRKRKAKEEERRKIKEAAALERVELWRKGEDVSTLDAPITALRVKGEIVQTSRGAEVPVAHAKRLWPLIKRCKEAGTSYAPLRNSNANAQRVGAFTVDSIDAEGNLSIGCHRIAWQEVARLAPALGLS
jgi:hypothetical protein